MVYFSGPNCSSAVRLSIQDPSQPRGLRVVHSFCSPLEVRPASTSQHHPTIIKASLVFLDFNTVNQTADMFSGAFAFQNSKNTRIMSRSPRYVLSS